MDERVTKAGWFGDGLGATAAEATAKSTTWAVTVTSHNACVAHTGQAQTIDLNGDLLMREPRPLQDLIALRPRPERRKHLVFNCVASAEPARPDA